MEEKVLDYIWVPIGLAVMLSYHIWLFYQIKNRPIRTVIGINSINRKVWVETMMQDTSKTGVLAVQTLRNNIMASTLLATMAIMMSSIIAVLMTNKNGNPPPEVVFGDKSQLAFSVKFFAILLCFLLAFLLNVQSIRYYSHASILINVPINNNRIAASVSSAYLTAEYVAKAVNRGSYFWSLGLRAFYFSFPLFMWIFGPIPMFVCCVVLVSMLYFLDVTFIEFGSAVRADDVDDERDVEEGR